MSGKLKADTTNNYAYNKKLQPFAKKLRKEMTKAEACLWKYALRAGQMKGVSIQKAKALLAGSGLQPEPMSLFGQ